MDIVISNQNIINVDSATLRVRDEDMVEIRYRDKHDQPHKFFIHARDGVLIIAHEKTEAAFGIAADGNVLYSPPTIK